MTERLSNSPVVPTDPPELDPELAPLLLPVIDSKKSDSDRLEEEDDDLDVKGSCVEPFDVSFGANVVMVEFVQMARLICLGK